MSAADLILTLAMTIVLVSAAGIVALLAGEAVSVFIAWRTRRQQGHD